MSCSDGQQGVKRIAAKLYDRLRVPASHDENLLGQLCLSLFIERCAF